MQFRTECTPSYFGKPIAHADVLTFLGSCFSEHIAQRFEYAKFNVTANPMGVVFHPAPLFSLVHRAISSGEFRSEELVQHDGVWHNLFLPNKYSNVDRDVLLAQSNEPLREIGARLKSPGLLVITFGTAWQYEYVSNHSIVANCHKLPAANFTKSHASVDMLIEQGLSVLQELHSKNPQCDVILTVSPVRHWKDGVKENSRSKSTLLLLCEALEDALSFVHYFPSYEIVMDDLRDYRYYKKDLLHPNELAIDYIWEKVQASVLSPEAKEIMENLTQLQRSLSHRPLQPESASHLKFQKQLLNRLLDFQYAHPEIDMTNEVEQLKGISL